jgi:hypothetical protein
MIGCGREMEVHNKCMAMLLEKRLSFEQLIDCVDKRRETSMMRKFLRRPKMGTTIVV